MQGNTDLQAAAVQQALQGRRRDGSPLALSRRSASPGGFRADVNGLRAVAVVSVILFHFGVGSIRGGYVGVDVFFVISGYLMSGIIWGGLDSGRFKLFAFIWGRVTRVAPALLAMTVYVMGVGAVISLPNQWIVTAQQAVWSITFAINVLFVSDVGYFSPLAAQSWFLHCWSLAVEFQFYVAYSLLLIGLRRWLSAKAAAVAVCCLAVVSLIYCVAETRTNTIVAFYLMPSRFWEFVVGGAVLFLPKLKKTILRSALCWIALALLSYVVVSFDTELVYPGLWSVLPVLCSAVIIWVDSQNPLLCHPTVQFLGTISYSLYLWHWPLLLTARYLGHSDSLLDIVILSLMTTLMSYLSYKTIESLPRERLKKPKVRNYLLLLTPELIVLAICVGVQRTGGFPDRLNEATYSLMQNAVYANDWREAECFLRPDQDFSQFKPFCFGTDIQPKNLRLLLWGDSHAAHLYPGIAAQSWSIKYEIEQLTASACSPVQAGYSTSRPYCHDIQHDTLAAVLRQKPDIVVLSSAWFAWGGKQGFSELDQLPSVSQKLGDLVRVLRSGGVNRVIVIGPIPQWDLALPQAYFRERFRTGVSFPKYLHPLQSATTMHAVDSGMSDFVMQAGGEYVSLFDKMCRSEGCRPDVMTASGPALIEFDGEHLTRAGSDWIANQVIGPAIGQAVTVEPEVARDSDLEFNIGGNGTQYLASGWRPPEPWGVWSLTTRPGVLSLPIRTWTPHKLEITFSGQLGGSLLLEHFGVQVDGDDPIQLTVTQERQVSSVTVPLGQQAVAMLMQTGVLRVRFTAPDGQSPTEMGQNQDSRKLGFGLREIHLR